MKPRILTLVALLCCIAARPSISLGSTDWEVDGERSKFVFVPTVAGGEFEGRFPRFDAAIRFDPADLSNSSFTVEVNLVAAVTGDAERDSALLGADFFAVKRWPTARFTATRFIARDGTRFEALGRLQLRDVTREVRLPFEFVPGPGKDAARLRGGTTVQRLDFGVGQGDWRDTQWIDNDVRISFDLFLHRTH